MKQKNNLARKFLQEFKQIHFPEATFNRLHLMSEAEIREYMASKIDKMICADYEIDFNDVIFSAEKFKEVCPHPKSLDDISKEVLDIWKKEQDKNPLNMVPFFWKDAFEKIPQDGSPFWDKELLGELTMIERTQVDFLKRISASFFILASDDTQDLFDFGEILPGTTPSDAFKTNPYSIWNFDSAGTLETFIKNTPYRSIAAALSHSVVVFARQLWEKELETVGKNDEAYAKICREAVKMFEADSVKWFHFCAAFFPVNQYIAGTHSLLHAVEYKCGVDILHKYSEGI